GRACPRRARSCCTAKSLPAAVLPDSKSAVRKGVSARVRPSAPFEIRTFLGDVPCSGSLTAERRDKRWRGAGSRLPGRTVRCGRALEPPADVSMSTLSALIRSSEEKIAQRWADRLIETMVTGSLDREDVIDSLREFLRELERALAEDPTPELAEEPRRPPRSAIAVEHGSQRFRLGSDIA